ncbi:site-2 protease family protein [Caulobacter soli]|uniref:site-2 protease family protein n=1 Tax=Caulobacter soli TaxID=2708539 RepID=UPI0013EB55F6|nr:site-2 protease family protein [Caulobacter soli]
MLSFISGRSVLARTVRRCRQCGFRSDVAASFRLERGGMFERPGAICFGCKPYPARPDHLYWRGWFNQLFTSAVIAWWCGFERGLTFGVTVWLTLVIARPLAILIHEAGHVLAAKTVGFDVVEARVGRGPVTLARRAWGVRWTVHRYAALGGLTLFVPPEGASRWRRAVSYLGGALANLAAASVAAALFPPLDEALWGLAGAVAGGWLLLNLLMALSALWPTKGGDHPSDGALIVGLLRKRAPETDERFPLLRQTQRLTLAGRFSEAADIFEAQLKTWPNDPYVLGMVVHCTAQAQGDRAALARYRLLAAEAPAGPPRPFDWHAAMTGWMAGNIAWSAINAGPDADLDLAERQLQIALALQPDAPAITGTHGAWLAARGQADIGERLLTQALPELETPADKAAFARRLAQARRARNDAVGATEAERLADHILARAHERPAV